MRSALLLGLLLALGACKGAPEGVAVTEAPPVAFPAAPGRYAEGDTTYAAADSLADDSLADDSLAADALAADSAARPPAAVRDSTPDFGRFWTTFRQAARSGRRGGVAALAVVGPGGVARADWPQAAEALTTEPFRTPLLALDARSLAYDGSARTASLLVGFDTDGTVVPQDEAETDSAVLLRFEIVGAPGGRAWRLVRVEFAG